MSKPTRNRAPAAPKDWAPPASIRPDIVQAAARLFSRRGYHGTSMQHIAEELGMRKASLYHHVRSKEDFLFAIHESLIDRLISETMQVVSGSSPPDLKLREIIKLNTQIVADDVDALIVFLRERDALKGERWAALVERRDLYEHMVSAVLSDGIRGGTFRAGEPRMLTKIVLAAPGWMSVWYRPGGPLGPEALGDLFAEFALAGLGFAGDGRSENGTPTS